MMTPLVLALLGAALWPSAAQREPPARVVAITIGFAPLDSVLADSAYRSADRYVGPAGMSWLIRWAETRGVAIPKEPREDPYIQRLAFR